EEYQRLRTRAKVLYGRAHEYAKKGLLLSAKDFPAAFQANIQEALLRINKRQDVPFLYWAGTSLAKLITLSKTDPAAAIRLPEAAAYMQRALELDPDYDSGAIHEFYIAYEARGAIMGGDVTKAEEHYKKAVVLGRGMKLSPLLTYAEAFCIPDQNTRDFDALMKQIMDFDIDRYPEYRLVNALAKKRAQQLLKKKDDLFLGE
ncbi:MAG: TRAP transporter TatT component family protein, partial [Pseudomonadota bacterium]